MITKSEPGDQCQPGTSCSEHSAEYGIALTQSQNLIWTGQQLYPEVPLYNMAMRFDIAAALNCVVFSEAFQQLICERDALRTVIFATDSGVRQVVLAEMKYETPFYDFSSKVSPEAAADEWINSHVTDQLNLTVRNFHSALIKTGNQKFIWYFNQHHIVSDAWSFALLFKRCSELYGQRLQRRKYEPITNVAFTDYISFQSEQMESIESGKAQEYWNDAVASLPPWVRFYGESKEVSSPGTMRIPCPLGPGRTRRLKRLAAAADFRDLSVDLTLFNILACTLFAYLTRISNQRSVAIGVPAHNRASLRFRETMGLFMEMYPLVVEIKSEDTFRTLLQTVKISSSNFLRHARPGVSSVFSTRGANVVLNYIHARFDSFNGAATHVEWLHAGYGDPGHHLRLQVLDLKDGDDLLLYFDFNSELFGAELSERAPGHFLRLLDSFLENPDQSIFSVSLVSEIEQHLMQTGFNPVWEQNHGLDQTVLTLFSEQTSANPDSIAITADGVELTYAALDQQSTDLAWKLVNRKPESGQFLVGIYADRSVDMMVSIWATLKAGAAYVPLEPGIPEARLSYIIKDTGLHLVLTQSQHAPALAGHDVDTLLVDTGGSGHEQINAKAAPQRPAGSDLAYVIYTSGSTGVPKGVEVTHLGLANYVTWAIGQYTTDHKPCFPLFSAFGFDLTVTSIFVPLCCGGSVRIYGAPANGLDLSVLDVFNERCVDSVKLTPAHLQLISHLDLRDSPVKTLIVGGEDLKTSLAQKTLEVFGPELRIFNEYGPTEAVVGCMIHQFNPSTDNAGSVPIGRPAADTRVYILDEKDNLVPLGVEGEIAIASVGLSRGYLNQPELTAERFKSDPFQPGKQIYKTGDRGRFINPETVEYMGRNDDQYKIDGVRVEKAEVEQALLSHPEVSSCYVGVIRPYGAQDKRRTRYCVRCGLTSKYPNTSFDEEGVCNICTEFEKYKEQAQAYFKPLAELRTELSERADQKRGKFDCMVLLSGGKDSTYALYQIADMGFSVLAVTLDNGYISDGAKANIRRSVSNLGIEHRFVRTQAMDAIFADSLKRHSNVCYGCFKTIYTLALKIARDEGIPSIVTGLSRGQLFETRLTGEVFKDSQFDICKIDQEVLAARKIYHRIKDTVTDSVGSELFADDRIFDEVAFFDFYRYCDVSLRDTYDYLYQHAPWVRPQDTGRSTNCLINDTGIYVHKTKQGYHNYALPYSWDVRLGHKTREEALSELNDEIDVNTVLKNLNQIGYDDDDFFYRGSTVKLAAYYVSSKNLEVTELKTHMAKLLPKAMIPTYFLGIDAMPLTTNGKIDGAALPDPREQRPDLDQTMALPESETEHLLARIWQEVLRLNVVGIHDNFFDLGGDSIIAIQLISLANSHGVHITPAHLFTYQTIFELAAHLENTRDSASLDEVAPEIPTGAEQNSLINLNSDQLRKIAALLPDE